MKAIVSTWFFQAVALTAALFSFHSQAVAQSSTSTIPVALHNGGDRPDRLHWNGDTGVFTIFRSGDTSAVLNVLTGISGTASNGVDYKSIGSIVQLASGVTSNTVVIQPINSGQTDIKTVTLNLNGSPLMTPVNYEIGSPSTATVYIEPPGVSNVPPVVYLAEPTNGRRVSGPGKRWVHRQGY